MTIATTTSYQLPAQVAMQASLTSDFVAFHRFPELFSYNAGSIAASGSITLITGIAEFKIVLLRAFLSFTTSTLIVLRDGVTDWFAWMATTTQVTTLDLMPFGKVLGNGANLVLGAGAGGGTDFGVTTFYTFERN